MTDRVPSGSSHEAGNESAVLLEDALSGVSASSVRVAGMPNDDIVDLTITHVVAIITTAAAGLSAHNKEAADTMRGTARALLRKRADIKAQVLRK